MLALSYWSQTTQEPLQIERRCCLLYETSTSSYGLKHCFTVWDPVVKWECSRHWFSSWTQVLLPFFLPFSVCCLWHSMLPFFFFFLTSSCKMPACRQSVISCHSLQSGLWREGGDSPAGRALLCAPQPHPPNHDPHRAPNHNRPLQRLQCQMQIM